MNFVDRSNFSDGIDNSDSTSGSYSQWRETNSVKNLKRQAGHARFQRGLFAYHRGDYSEALKEFEKSLNLAARHEDWEHYVESCTYALRILAEREEFARIDKIEKRVLELNQFGSSHRSLQPSQLSSNATGFIRTDPQISPVLKSRAVYVLGICSLYRDCEREEQYQRAMRLFREATEYALLSGDKQALAAPLYGAATVLYARQDYQEALRELDRLEVLLSCLSLPDIMSAVLLLRSMVKRNLGAYDEALESAWRAFESLKHQPHLVLYLHTLCVLGTVFSAKGDIASARLYLDLADRSLKREEFPRIARLVDEAVQALGAKPSREKIDLLFDGRTGILIEKHKGEIRFEGQFVLRDLLRVFLESPGRVFSKDELAVRVWREPYNPDVHDNKIYVTIKRLRKLLETETPRGRGKSTDYILRAKNGYFLNPKVRVLIKDQPTTVAAPNAMLEKSE